MASSINSCTICLDSFAQNTEVVKKDPITFSGDKALDPEKMVAIATKCNHVFHESCLAKWINEYIDKTTHPQCPMCRKNLTEAPSIPPVQLVEIPDMAAINDNFALDEVELLQEDIQEESQVLSQPMYNNHQIWQLFRPIQVQQPFQLGNPLVPPNYLLSQLVNLTNSVVSSLPSVASNISANTELQMPSSQLAMSTLESGQSEFYTNF